jgi:hypothetical protein
MAPAALPRSLPRTRVLRPEASTSAPSSVVVRGRRWGQGFLGGLAVLLATARLASAHGVPEKVVDDVVVSLVLVPVHETTTLRFFFRDRRSGGPIAVPIAFRVRLRDEGAGAQIEESPPLTTTTGTGEFVPRAPHAGLHEVVLEFERADRPGRIYRPEDWLLEMGGPGTARPVPGGWVLAVGLAILVGGGWRRRWIRRRRSGS